MGVSRDAAGTKTVVARTMGGTEACIIPARGLHETKVSDLISQVSEAMDIDLREVELTLITEEGTTVSEHEYADAFDTASRSWSTFQRVKDLTLATQQALASILESL